MKPKARVSQFLLLLGVAGLAFFSMSSLAANLEWRYGNEELRYVTGGVGQEERSAMRSQFPETDLKVVNLEEGSGAYMANATITIIDANGDNLLQTVSEGPWFFVDLKPGTYRIKSVVGSSEQERTIQVGSQRVREVRFRWVKVQSAERPFPMPAVPLPGEPLPVEPESSGSSGQTGQSGGRPDVVTPQASSTTDKAKQSVEIDFDNANPIIGPKKTEVTVAEPISAQTPFSKTVDGLSQEPVRLPPTETDEEPYRQSSVAKPKPKPRVTAVDESCNPPPDKILEADCLFR